MKKSAKKSIKFKFGKSHKGRSKNATMFLRPQIGTHIDRHPDLCPGSPSPKPPGERRGVGKPFIKVLTHNAISYRLNDDFNAKVFTHNETCPQTLIGDTADAFIREWLGLDKKDYLRITGVRHTFTHDVPKEEPLNSPHLYHKQQNCIIVRTLKDGSEVYLATYGQNLDEITFDYNKRNTVRSPAFTQANRIKYINRLNPNFKLSLRHV